MTIRVDHDEYVAEHADARVWLEGYYVQTIALFEPFIRDAVARETGGVIADFLKGVRRC